MGVTIYHNPRCSKSRKTLQLLEDRGTEPKIIEYLKKPPGNADLKQILKLLDLNPRELMRKNEAVYYEKGLDSNAMSDEQLIDAMIGNPILIERPIVLANGKAAIGRPPENVLEII